MKTTSKCGLWWKYENNEACRLSWRRSNDLVIREATRRGRWHGGRIGVIHVAVPDVLSPFDGAKDTTKVHCSFWVYSAGSAHLKTLLIEGLRQTGENQVTREILQNQTMQESLPERLLPACDWTSNNLKNSSGCPLVTLGHETCFRIFLFGMIREKHEQWTNFPCWVLVRTASRCALFDSRGSGKV